MITFTPYGNLGNRLFQVAALKGIAKKYNQNFIAPVWEYADYFNETIPVGSIPVQNNVKEPYFHHCDDLPVKDGNNTLDGYFQSTKYWNDKTPFTFKQSFIDKVKGQNNYFDKSTIAISIRRGDYVNNPNYHLLPVEYYYLALFEHFPDWKNYNIIFFSDDMGYCKVHFECWTNAYFAEGLSPIEQLCLMAQCDFHIISNSTFSWWGAYLSKGKKVIRPTHLFAGKLADYITGDFWPEDWVSFEYKDKKIQLRDVTFTIPVSWDHKDREHNLNISVCLLQRLFDTRIIVMEQGSDKFGYMGQWCKYVKFDSQTFHRTKMLNDMCNMADTDIIVNWDADVIIPPMQILMAVEALKSGEDVVYPYDGRFARVKREQWFSKIEKHLDIGIVSDAKFKGKYGNPMPISSVGGAVMFNKDAFISGGMENEYMISYAPEDCERWDRFHALGFKVKRIAGALYHIDHYIGPNSSSRNPLFKDNHKELDKIRAMTPVELQAYVDTWPWRSQYTTEYYHKIAPGSIRSAKAVMTELERMGLRTVDVIDIGCGVGEWNNGNPHYHGVDYKVRKKDLLIPENKFIECNLEKDSIEIPSDKFDLCLCLEVAEHIRPHRAGDLVKMLCSLSDRILFSAAIPMQGGQGHVNEQWQSWWAELFKQNGFGAATVQPDIRNNPDIEHWYKQNIVLYERGAAGTVHDFVLPEYYAEIVGNLKQTA